MAICTNAAFNADTFSTWDGTVGFFDPIFIAIASADTTHVQYWSGTGFAVDNSRHVIGGTVNTIEDHSDGGGYRITGLAHDAATIASYQANDPQGLLAYIFNGNDVLIGSIEDDVLNGYAGNDSLVGGGSHYLYPGYNDTLEGGTGNDTIKGGVGDDIMFGGSGIDTVSYQAGAFSGVTVSLAMTGPQATGGAGSDTLSGFERLTGSRFADKLTGNNGHNLLTGLAGDDTLIGRAGNDTLGGGTGADKFLFNTPLNASNNVDTISGFSVVEDVMRLDQTFFTGLPTGTLTSGRFYSAPGATGASDATDRIIYDSTSGNLYFDADGTGGVSAAVLFATLAGTPHPTVTAADFFIVA